MNHSLEQRKIVTFVLCDQGTDIQLAAHTPETYCHLSSSQSELPVVLDSCVAVAPPRVHSNSSADWERKQVLVVKKKT